MKHLKKFEDFSLTEKIEQDRCSGCNATVDPEKDKCDHCGSYYKVIDKEKPKETTNAKNKKARYYDDFMKQNDDR